MPKKENILELPQITAEFSFALPPKIHFLLLGGRAPSDSWLKETCADKTLWAIDRGIDQLRKNALVPQMLIGDADSGTQDSWGWAAAHNVAIERHPTAKTYTDTELALFALAKLPTSFAVISGAFGGRLDHLFSTLFSAAYADVPNCLADDRETVFFLRGGQHLRLSFNIRPVALSLLPISQKSTGINLSGTRWPLKNAELAQSLPFAVSNETTENSCAVSLQDGLLGIYFNF